MNRWDATESRDFGGSGGVQIDTVIKARSCTGCSAACEHLSEL